MTQSSPFTLFLNFFCGFSFFFFVNFHFFVNDQDKNKDQSNSGINHGNKSSPDSQEEDKKRKKSITIRSKSSGWILEEIKEIIEEEKTRRLVLDYCNQTSPVSFQKEFPSS